MTNWVERFHSLAKEVATWSKDPDCQVGAVVVSPDRRLFTAGYNGFPAGIQDKKNRLSTKSVKNYYTVHAEINDSKSIKKTASDVKANDGDKGAYFVAPEPRLTALLESLTLEDSQCQLQLH